MSTDTALTALSEATDEAPVDVVDGSIEDRLEDLVEDELLVEEISIDGMCGVY